MSRKEWDEAADAVARAVVRVMPELNENIIKSKVFAFFASENERSTSPYNDSGFYYIEDVCKILETAFDLYPADESSMVVTNDFRWAFEQLSDNYQYRILERYQHSVIRPHDSPERGQLNRALRKLADILNSWNRNYNHEGPGSRQPYSNARATSEISRDFDGNDYNPDGPFRLDGGSI